MRKDDIYNWFTSFKSELVCKICGEQDTSCLDFHHLYDKRLDINTMVSKLYSIRTIKEELEKCIPVCANCHRKIHSDLRNFDNNLIEWEEMEDKYGKDLTDKMKESAMKNKIRAMEKKL